jgi:hypothetical protein
MCHFLTISFNKEFEEQFRSVFPAKEFRLRENKNPFFEKNFGENIVSFDVTDGHCSCSIRADLAAETATADDAEKIIENYRRKGWSENKIRRALGNRQSKPEIETGTPAREYLARIFERIGSYELFTHMYKGAIGDEPLKAASRKDLKIQELLDKTVEVPDDVIIKIKK